LRTKSGCAFKKHSLLLLSYFKLKQSFCQQLFSVSGENQPAIAVRVSCGHLCEAEAPTEPAGETAVRRVAIRLSPKGITDSFVLRTQNDKPFSNCNRRKMRGNPFP